MELLNCSHIVTKKYITCFWGTKAQWFKKKILHMKIGKNNNKFLRVRRFAF